MGETNGGLPPHLSIDGDSALPKESGDIWYHNWLYSVVPGDTAVWDFSGGNYDLQNFMGIFLAGYCRNCNRAFTVRLETEQTPGLYKEQQLDIAKEGCVPPPRS